MDREQFLEKITRVGTEDAREFFSWINETEPTLPQYEHTEHLPQEKF